MQFQNLSVEDGLSNNFVKSVYKDSDGYMWFGTLDGIDRFDGTEVVNYSNWFDNKTESVNAIIEDADNKLWIGTETKLYCWNKSTPLFNYINIGSSKTRVNCLANYTDSIVIAGTSNGLVLINSYSFQQQTITFHPDTLNNINNVTGIVVRNKKQIWLTTSGGLIQVNPENKKHLVFKMGQRNNDPVNRFSCLTIIGNELFIGTQSSGVLSFDLNNYKFRSLPDIGNNYILSMHGDSSKTLYVGTDAGGLKVVNVTTWEVKSIEHDNSDPSSIVSNAVYSFFIDELGRYWVGTYSGGVSYSLPTNGVFKIYNHGSFYSGNSSVRSIYFDTEGYKHIGTRDGLFIMKPDSKEIKWVKKDDIKGLRSDIILNIYPWNNKVLIGTYGGGISVYTKGQDVFETFIDNDDFYNGCIYGFGTDKDNNLWIGSLQGLYCVNTKTDSFNFFSELQDGLTDKRIYSIFIDSQNRLWAGTMTGTLVFDIIDNTIKPIDLYINLPVHKTISFFEDSFRNIWIGTEKGGLFKLSDDLKTISNITDADGLPSNSVTAITESKPGVYWISTLKGLCKYDSQIDRYYTFQISDGLPGLVFNPSAIYKDKDNIIWLGNEKGLVYFDSFGSLEQRCSDKIVITELFVDGNMIDPYNSEILNRPLSRIEQIQLNRGQNSIGFKFLALNYLSPTENKYACRLKSKSDKWEILGHVNTKFYDRLPPGNHQFEVCLLNRAGYPDETSVKSLTIAVRPAWHQNLWIVSAIAVLIIGLILQGLLYVLRTKKKIKKMLTGNRAIANKEKYESSHLTLEKSTEMLKRIKEYVESEKVYMKEDLKISHIADSLGYTIHEISQVINQNLNQNFTDFINHYRIIEIKKRMLDEKYAKYTLIAIAESCGIKSKTSFYRIFKKETGKTPAEFLSQNGK
ncbi:MAG: helix-turn-helix domain-containing protein [Marinilabiliaceae bacterium]|nr:helix-turn-helix domain-containing protein [Marinilabiliaceae bacterium]